jgi:hypothetical protein
VRYTILFPFGWCALKVRKRHFATLSSGQRTALLFVYGREALDVAPGSATDQAIEADLIMRVMGPPKNPKELN